MGLSLWKKRQVIRRFTYEDGFQRFSDMSIMADVQTTDKSTVTGPDGDLTLQTLKVFTDVEIIPANKETGALGDRIWYQGKWFECRSARLSDNTILRHWTSTFVEMNNQNGKPEVPDED